MDARPKKTCENCGGAFRVWGYGRPPKCCGDYCRLQLWRRNQKAPAATQPTKPTLGARILSARSTRAAARILAKEAGFGPGAALEAAAIMRGESNGDVLVPPLM